mgnify:FL=1
MVTVTMRAGRFWKLHKHNCVETILVFKGHLKEHLSGDMVGAAEILQFDKFESHLVESLSDSIFYVEFKRP